MIKEYVLIFSTRAGGDIPKQGDRSDIKKMKDAVLADPTVKVSDLIEAYGRAGTMLNVIKVLRSETLKARDRKVPHQGTYTHTHTHKSRI